MTNEQIDTLLRAIKATYPSLNITKDLMNEWGRRLASYDFEDVEQNFNDYVLSGNTQTITIIDLIKGLHTREQKQPMQGYFFCSRCNRRYESIEQADKCYERDMDIDYIKRMSNKFGIKYTDYFGNLYEATLDTINQNYDDFIIRVVEENKKNPILRGQELDGLMLYYNQVIRGVK